MAQPKPHGFEPPENDEQRDSQGLRQHGNHCHGTVSEVQVRKQAAASHHAAQYMVLRNSHVDPKVLAAMVREVRRAAAHDQRLRQSPYMRGTQTSQSLSREAMQAMELARAYLRANPLPPADVLRAQATEHLELLREISREHGEPNAEDWERAARVGELLRELG